MKRFFWKKKYFCLFEIVNDTTTSFLYESLCKIFENKYTGIKYRSLNQKKG